MGELADRRAETGARIAQLRDRLKELRLSPSARPASTRRDRLDDARRALTAIWIFLFWGKAMALQEHDARRAAC